MIVVSPPVGKPMCPSCKSTEKVEFVGEWTGSPGYGIWPQNAYWQCYATEFHKNLVVRSFIVLPNGKSKTVGILRRSY